MKIFKKVSIVLVLVFSIVFGFNMSNTAQAATTPSLGMASTYGVLSSTYTNTSAGTTINGDVGFTTGPAVAPLGTHTNYGSGAPYATAGADQGSALSALASQACTFTFGGGAINLSTDTTHGTAGVYAPGVYCSSGAMDVGGPLTLSGSGTFIFRPGGALTTTAGAIVTLTGASACNVFWTPAAATTFAANTTFAGTVISNAGITVGANTNWTGRSLAFGGTVTSDTDTITVPSCSVPPPVAACTLLANPTSVQTGSSSLLSWTTTNASTFSIDQSVGAVSPVAAGSISVTPLTTTTYTGTAILVGGSTATCSATVTVTALPAASGTLHVVKQVVNNNGGIATASLFNLHVKLSGTDVAGSPAVGTATPGTPYTLSAGTYVVSEDVNASYTQSFSGACDSNGSVTLSAGADVTCTITNDDVATGILPATLNVTKIVINDNGGTRTVASFPLFVNGASVTSGATNTFAAPATYTVTETSDSNYTRTFSGDCNINGQLNLIAGDHKTCTITNNDIAPVIVPKLPKTGFPPQEQSTPWNIIASAGILGALFSFYLIRNKKFI